MKFLADANIPRRLVDRLRATGHQVFWAYEDAAPGASDENLIGRAAAEDRVIPGTKISVSSCSRTDIESESF